MEQIRNLYTRKDIIDIWLNDNKKNLDKYCCPNCNDLLFESDEHENAYVCQNLGCEYYFLKNDDYFIMRK